MIYRSDVVGSLLRPSYLKEARLRQEAGSLGAPAFKAIEDRAVDEAVAMQCRTGLDVITDGELRRYAFYGHLVDPAQTMRYADKLAAWSAALAEGR